MAPLVCVCVCVCMCVSVEVELTEVNTRGMSMQYVLYVCSYIGRGCIRGMPSEVTRMVQYIHTHTHVDVQWNA